MSISHKQKFITVENGPVKKVVKLRKRKKHLAAADLPKNDSNSQSLADQVEGELHIAWLRRLYPKAGY